MSDTGEAGEDVGERCFIERSGEGFDSRGKCMVRKVMRKGEMLGGGYDLSAENVCDSINSTEEVVDDAQSLMRCGYCHHSPAPQINGRLQGSSCVLVQLRVSGNKGITGGELP